MSPSQVSSGLRFFVFACKSSDQSYAFLISSDDESSSLGFVGESEKRDLQWNSIQYENEGSLILNGTDYLLSNFTNMQYFVA